MAGLQQAHEVAGCWWCWGQRAAAVAEVKLLQLALPPANMHNWACGCTGVHALHVVTGFWRSGP